SQLAAWRGDGSCRASRCRDSLQLGSRRTRHARFHVRCNGQKERMKPTLAQRAEFYAMRGMLGALGLVSWETACRIGAGLGAAAYNPLRIRKDVVEKQIAAAFPEKSPE